MICENHFKKALIVNLFMVIRAVTERRKKYCIYVGLRKFKDTVSIRLTPIYKK